MGISIFRLPVVFIITNTKKPKQTHTHSHTCAHTLTQMHTHTQIHTHKHTHTHIHSCARTHTLRFRMPAVCSISNDSDNWGQDLRSLCLFAGLSGGLSVYSLSIYGVATISRLLKIIGLFCERAL